MYSLAFKEAFKVFEHFTIGSIKKVDLLDIKDLSRYIITCQFTHATNTLNVYSCVLYSIVNVAKQPGREK